MLTKPQLPNVAMLNGGTGDGDRDGDGDGNGPGFVSNPGWACAVVRPITMGGRHMHILFTTDYLDYRNIGGSGRVILELARRLIDRDHEVTVLAGAPEAERLVLDLDDVQLQYVSFPYSVAAGRGMRFFFRARRAVRAAYRSLAQDHDVVIHNQPFSADAIGRVRAPAIYLFHSPWPLEYLADRFGEDSLERLAELGSRARMAVAVRSRIESRALSRVETLVTLSETMKRHVCQIHGVSEKRVHVHPGGVDLERFRPRDLVERGEIRQSLGISDGEQLLVCVRRMVPRTGVDLLLEAFAGTGEELPGTRLLIAGKGEQLEDLERRRDELSLKRRVRFLGYVTDDELPRLYAAADLAVVPTRALEGFGLATLEALACGTPVAATPVGGTVEILTGLDPELLASAAEVDALADCLLRWGCDRHRLRELRGRCRSYVEESYSWERMADGIDTLLEEALLEPSLKRFPGVGPSGD